MESVKKRANLFGRIKWLGLFFGLIMYYATADVFGDILSLILACIAATAFYIICDNERKSIVARHVSDHLEEVLENFGQKGSVFEIKMAGAGMIVRVYLIRAGERAAACSKLIMDTISASWYRSKVWVTQIVDLEREEDLSEAQRVLNDELIDNVRNNRD